jgi:acetyl-CoA carboxylase biotin carboxyl carrier protein
MSKGGKPTGSVFDVARIKEIVELMEQHDLVEVDLQDGDDKIKLNRGVAAAPHMIAAPAPAAPAPAAPTAPTGVSDGTVTIKSPIVGTFYARPNPESETFVKVGSVVSSDTVVCIVEAMKVFNEIPAECSGTVVEVLIEDQQPVDVGKPLFRVKPNA